MSRPANPNNYGAYFQPEAESAAVASGASAAPIGSGGISTLLGYEQPYSQVGGYRREAQTPNTVQIVGECAPDIYKVLSILRKNDAGNAQSGTPVPVPIMDIMTATGSEIRSLLTAIQSLSYARLLTLQDAPNGPVIMLTAEGSRLVTSFG